jgi:hypothetical protein
VKEWKISELLSAYVMCEEWTTLLVNTFPKSKQYAWQLSAGDEKSIPAFKKLHFMTDSVPTQFQELFFSS